MARARITDDQVFRLKMNAVAARDAVMFAICMRADGGGISESWALQNLSSAEHTRITRMSPAKARAVCARAIADAAAQCDE